MVARVLTARLTLNVIVYTNLAHTFFPGKYIYMINGILGDGFLQNDLDSLMLREDNLIGGYKPSNSPCHN